MRHKTLINKRLFYAVIIFAVFFLNFCKSEKQEAKTTDILSRRQFISILIDIHIADALLNKEGLFDSKLTHPDSMSFYNYIFIKHNTSRQIFYNTLYFYLEDMNKFSEIQAIVIDSLTKKYELLDSLEKISLKQQDLWDMKRNWSLPEDGVTNSLPFKIKIQKHGTYRLSAKIISYPDDMSKDLSLKIIATYSDSTFDVREEKARTKDAVWRDYNVIINTNPSKRLEYIEGEVLYHATTTTYMHLQVSEIMLTFAEPEKDTVSNSIDSLKVPQ